MITQNRRSRLGRWLAALAVLVVVPSSARAHTIIKGADEFYSGLLHPVLTPSHILLVLGLGLLASQQEKPTSRAGILTFIGVVTMTLAFTATKLISGGVYQSVLLALALCVAALVALEKKVPKLVCQLLFAASALAIGLDSAVENGTTAVIIKMLVGTWLSLMLLVFNIAEYGRMAGRRHWLKVGVRVLGSWIIAISLLVLAFALKKPQAPS